MKADVTGFTSAATDSVTAKAVLRFYPPDGETISVSTESSHKAAGEAVQGGGKAFLDGVADAHQETEEQLKRVEEKVREPIKKIADPGGAEKSEQAVETKTGFTVTFPCNPASLHISAYGGGMAAIMNYGARAGATESDKEKKDGGQVDYGPINEHVTVHFKVVFDAVKNTQAFLADKINYSPINPAKRTGDSTWNSACTVRPVVEGFLAAVRSAGARRVVFQWGQLLYGGYLNNVQCRYTMFDLKGEAVRAEVDLSLVSSGHNDHDEMTLWRKRYDAYMKGKDSLFQLPQGGSRYRISEKMGRLEKAYILFHTQSENQELKELLRKRAQTENQTKGEEEIKKEEAEVEALKAKVFQRLSDMTAKISDAANHVAGEEPKLTELKQTVETAGYRPIRIQYNPASITLHSRGGEMMTREGGFGETSNPGRFQKNAIPMETVLSMELMFDGAVAPISELFVAAIASDYSRLVCLVWNKMAFWGELCEAEVEYTMFDHRGNPIRSRVSVRIRQDGEQAEGGAYENNWMKAFQNLEKEAQKLLHL